MNTSPSTEGRSCFACKGTGIIKGSIPALDRPCVCRKVETRMECSRLPDAPYRDGLFRLHINGQESQLIRSELVRLHAAMGAALGSPHGAERGGRKVMYDALDEICDMSFDGATGANAALSMQRIASRALAKADAAEDATPSPEPSAKAGRTLKVTTLEAVQCSDWDYPVEVRPAFTLRNHGHGIAHDSLALQALVEFGLRASPTSEVQLTVLGSVPEPGAFQEALDRACYVLMEMMQAYERRIRSDCNSPEQLAAKPWECSEYIRAERFLKAIWKDGEAQPFAALDEFLGYLRSPETKEVAQGENGDKHGG